MLQIILVLEGTYYSFIYFRIRVFVKIILMCVYFCVTFCYLITTKSIAIKSTSVNTCAITTAIKKKQLKKVSSLLTF